MGRSLRGSPGKSDTSPQFCPAISGNALPPRPKLESEPKIQFEGLLDLR